MGLFKKKPGGTKIGNLLRVVSGQVTGGVLGQGQDMIPVGGVGSVVGQAANNSSSSVVNQGRGVFQQFWDSIIGIGKIGNDGVRAKLSAGSILGVGALIFLVYYLFFKKKSYATNKSNRRRYKAR